MTFSPASSIAPTSVTVSGTVSADVTDRAARLVGHTNVDNFPASQAVTGPLTAAELVALEPLTVSGPLTDAQLRASRVPVDGSGVTQPVSAAALPLPAGAAKDSTLTDGTARVGGTVTVGDGGGSLTVDGPLTDAQLAARLPLGVTGPLTDTQLRASAVPISDGGGSLTVDGTVAATQGTSPWVTDGSAVTQPVSADELPLPDGAADNHTLSEVALTAILERDKLAVT